MFQFSVPSFLVVIQVLGLQRGLVARMLVNKALDKHLVGPVTDTILLSSEVSKAEVRLRLLINVHSGPFLNRSCGLTCRVSFFELIYSKNNCIEVLDHLIRSAFHLVTLTIASSFVMRLAHDEVLYRAFLLHDWLAIVVNLFILRGDHGRHLDSRLTRYVKFGAHWHKSGPSKLRISHLTLEIIAQSHLLLSICTLAMHPESDLVNVKRVQRMILSKRHLLPMGLVKCNNIVCLESLIRS